MKMRTRHSLRPASVLAFCLLALSTLVGRADETFVCEDGSSIVIDNANRAGMQDHSCVKAWFANDLARRQANAGSPTPEVQPIVRRTTARRAAALRDLRERPAYLAWSRARTPQVGSSPRGAATVARDHARSQPSEPLGVTIRVPADRR